MKVLYSRTRSTATAVAALALVLSLAIPATVFAVSSPDADPVKLPSAESSAGAIVGAAQALEVPFAPYKPSKLDPAQRLKVRSVAKVAAAKAASTAKVATRKSSGGSELSQARAILRGLIARHPILAGATVEIGRTPGRYQAVAYYTAGRIVISPSHTASLTRILNHEIWHVIDWRDNGRIDWYENVPPGR